MANTYSQLFIHLIFAVKYRDAVLDKSWRDELIQYIIGIIEKRNNKVCAIGGMEDHIHILISLSPEQSLSELVRDVKRASTLWIEKKGFVRSRFAWQNGFGAFSYAKSQLHTVANYVQNQENHHKKISFHNEYTRFLELFDVDFDDRYTFQPLSPSDNKGNP